MSTWRPRLIKALRCGLISFNPVAFTPSFPYYPAFLIAGSVTYRSSPVKSKTKQHTSVPWPGREPQKQSKELNGPERSSNFQETGFQGGY